MPVPFSKRWCALAVLALATSASGAARADVFVTPESELVVNATLRRALVAHAGGSETLLEEVIVANRSPTFVWLRALPARPEITRVPPATFQTLDELTQVQEPYNHVIRGGLFGPSVVTLLTSRLANAPQPAEDLEVPRELELAEMEIFEGVVETSTITWEMVFPEDMTSWLRRSQVTLPQALLRPVAEHMNRGGAIAAVLVRDSAPRWDQPARIGPLAFKFEAPRIVYPMLRRIRPFEQIEDLRLYLVDEAPMVSLTFETVWDTTPWERDRVGRNRFQVTFDANSADLQFFLADERGLNLPPNPWVVRSAAELAPEMWVDLSFQPAAEAVPIPSGAERGTAHDIFLCLLLGLTPLIYTPESWFLLWLTSRARSRARKEGKAFGLRLWAIYALVVAFYWLFTLEGAGRLAAVIPFFIGLAQLAWPFTEREDAPVRIQFKTKKKKA